MSKPNRATRRASRLVELPVTETLTGATGTDASGSRVPEMRADSWSSIAESLREAESLRQNVRLHLGELRAEIADCAAEFEDFAAILRRL